MRALVLLARDTPLESWLLPICSTDKAPDRQRLPVTGELRHSNFGEPWELSSALWEEWTHVFELWN
jgi:hypothetical protein